MTGDADLLLSARNLSFRYGATQVLDSVQLDVCAGEWVCLYGANGAGKSTLLHCIAGLAVPSPGTCVLYSGQTLEANPVAARRTFGFAVAPEEVPDELSIAQYLDLVSSAHGVNALGAVAARLLGGFRLGDHMNRRLSRCSLGTRQKAAIVAAFVGQPRLVVLDEPFNGLDSESLMVAKRVFSDFTRQGAILMASHGIEIVSEWCSHLDHLVDGTIRERIDLAVWRKQGESVRTLEERLMRQGGRHAARQATLTAR